MGRADYLAPGDWNAMCSRCGGKFKASMLRKHWQGMWRCPKCWEPRQPQDFVRAIPDVQTPPWVQPWPTVSYVLQSFPVSVSGAYTVSGGSGAVIITIQPGVVVSVLTIDSGPSTIIINNYGTVQSVVNKSGVTPTVNNFNGGVYPGVPWKLAFSVQPSNAGQGSSISPAVEVSIEDAFGTVVTSWPNEITIRLGLDSNPGGATLSGTTSIIAVNGVATFSDLSLDQIADGYTLWANGSDTISGDLFFPVTSSAFNVTAIWNVTAVQYTYLSDGPTVIKRVGYDLSAASGGPYGSVTPTTFNGYTIRSFQTVYLTTPASDETTLFVTGSGLTQNLFTSITINGSTLLSSSAVFTDLGTEGLWEWTTLALSAAGTYPMVIV